MGIVIDSDVLIDFLRGKEYAVSRIKELEKTEELATTDINAFELYFGAYNSKEKEKNLTATKGLLGTLKLLHSQNKAMEAAGQLLAHRKATGRLLDIKDVLIAAITINEGYTLLTNNKSHFEGISGLLLLD